MINLSNEREEIKMVTIINEEKKFKYGDITLEIGETFLCEGDLFLLTEDGPCLIKSGLQEIVTRDDTIELVDIEIKIKRRQ